MDESKPKSNKRLEKELWDKINQQYQRGDFKTALDLIYDYIAKFGSDRRIISLRRRMLDINQSAGGFDPRDASLPEAPAPAAEAPSEPPKEKKLKKGDTNPFVLSAFLTDAERESLKPKPAAPASPEGAVTTSPQEAAPASPQGAAPASPQGAASPEWAGEAIPDLQQEMRTLAAMERAAASASPQEAASPEGAAPASASPQGAASPEAAPQEPVAPPLSAPAASEPAPAEPQRVPSVSKEFLAELEAYLKKAPKKPTFTPGAPKAPEGRKPASIPRPASSPKAVSTPPKGGAASAAAPKPGQTADVSGPEPVASPMEKLLLVIKGFPLWLDILLGLTVLLILLTIINPFSAPRPQPPAGALSQTQPSGTEQASSEPKEAADQEQSPPSGALTQPPTTTQPQPPAGTQTQPPPGTQTQPQPAAEPSPDAIYIQYLDQIDQLLKSGEYHKALQIIAKAKKIKTDARLWNIIEQAATLAVPEEAQFELYLDQAEKLLEQGQYHKALQMAAKANRIQNRERLIHIIERIEEKLAVAQTAVPEMNDDDAFDAAKQKDTREAYEQYLNVHPHEGHRREAVRRIEEIERQEQENNEKRIIDKTTTSRVLWLRADYKRLSEAAILDNWSKIKLAAANCEEKVIGGSRVLIDYAAGLMWYVVENPIDLSRAHLWVCRRYAGYADWRLPSSDEAKSLLALIPRFLKNNGEMEIWTGDGGQLEAQTFWTVKYPAGTPALANQEDYKILFPVRSIKLR